MKGNFTGNVTQGNKFYFWFRHDYNSFITNSDCANEFLIKKYEFGALIW